MKYILLCGGIGKRCNGYSLPKPLNYIHGRHMIEYIIENIPSNEIYIVYNVFLDQFNFREIIINKFKNKVIHFSQVDYLTRGAVETAFIGINKLDLGEDNIVFIDNDNMHSFPDMTPKFDDDFIGYSMDFEKTNYSFITINDNVVTNIEEKIKISDNYCCGLYGFKNKESFISSAKDILYKNKKTKNEFYFSQLYKNKIEAGATITPLLIETTKHIGSYDEIVSQENIVGKTKLRVCFDLDNTLVTYPTVPNNYATVKPIHSAIALANQLKNEGHEIIIHTARRMATHNNNVGKVIKDIALVTINTLEKFGIPYDELIFGKPLADIYIDDRAINPYLNTVSYFGLFMKQDEFIPNKLSTNKYNVIERKGDSIYKTGPQQYIRGELFFYQNIPDCFAEYFPKMIDYNKMEDKIQIQTEFIPGIPLFYLYKNKLVTQKMTDSLFSILKEFHSFNDSHVSINQGIVYNNYVVKLTERFQNKSDYPFEDADEVFDSIINGIVQNYSPDIVPFIHGDCWFSNILLTYDDQFKFIDMKGQVYGQLTQNGDRYYDYGKLYQSIVGYDLILNEVELDTDYLKQMTSLFLEKCRAEGLNIEYLRWVTKSLIFGVFHSIDSKSSIKNNIWELIKRI